ncbi:MAG TPA: FAD-dependent oxidoreductase [Thermoanaerobaculia bacterium]|nr:FAD-dependent oxidoreductase [Thermoanaerobaculia bacterium]
MPAASQHVLIAGAGIFGVTAALELRRRGHRVTLLDPEPPPAPRAASTDVSKVVRREYGSDGEYLRLGGEAIAGWRRWNAQWRQPLYHQDGVLLLAGRSLDEEGYEGNSWRALLAAGCRPERLAPRQLAGRFPAWRPERYRDGFFHAEGGWVESGRVVARLLGRARDAGVTRLGGEGMAALLAGDRAVAGVRTTSGREIAADHVVVAAGAWTGRLLGLDGLWATAHPVFHLRPARPQLFAAERFPVFLADVAATGWYGFPLHPREGIVKVARHALGRRVDPDVPRTVAPGDEEALRAFLRQSLPALADAPLAGSRSCLYCDTADGHFWIDRDPEREGLTVASGGSGHAFKFAPLLGGWIADAVEGVAAPALGRFRWRRAAGPWAGEEEARAQGVE